MVKGITLMLVALAVLAIFGRLRFPKRKSASRNCPKCGRPLIGKGPCPCRTKKA